jgi:hypothetical protein
MKIVPYLSVTGHLLPVLVIGCAASPDSPDDLSSLAGVDQKSDAFSSKLKLEGTLGAGDAKSFDYSGHPRYAGFAFGGTKGDHVQGIVGCDSGAGDPVVWIVSSKFRVLAHATAMNDSPDTLAAVADLTLPTTGKYYLIMRDAHVQPGSFYGEIEGTTCFQKVECAGGFSFNHDTCECE